MIDCRFKPIKKWPGEPTASWKRQESRFKAGWQQTLDLMERELNHLRAKDITIEAFFEHRAIRNDGWPKSTARPTQPGIILSFESKQGKLVMPCDRFKDWESNVRAIALTLEHLRAVERYGVTTEKQEQYTGWLRLPAASEVDEAAQCALILCKFAAVDARQAQRVTTEKDFFNQTWGEAVRRTHSDTSSGSTEDFQRVLDARNRLRTLKGW